MQTNTFGLIGMLKNYLIHALFGNSVDSPIPAELLNIWEVVYLLKARNEVEAQGNFISFVDDSDLACCSALREDGQTITSRFLGVRFVGECPDEGFAWTFERGSVVEISYVEYDIHFEDLDRLKSARRVPVELTMIKRRTANNMETE